jgi:hypothetical protein
VAPPAGGRALFREEVRALVELLRRIGEPVGREAHRLVARRQRHGVGAVRGGAGKQEQGGEEQAHA